jgi:predicted Holliday junction resolvase-like endonuclease
MTEMVNGDVQSVANDTSNIPVHSPSPASSSDNAGNGSERFFKQSEVNELVGRARSEAIERYKRETSMASHQTLQSQVQNHEKHGGVVSQDEIRQIASEMAEKKQKEWIEKNQEEAYEREAHQIANQVGEKLKTTASKYPDFNDVLRNVKLSSVPQVAFIANQFDNTGDLLYEMGKNPSKLLEIEQLLARDMPELAISQMQRLSDSIKQNESASKIKHPNQPLSQMRPSSSGMDAGELSIRDYKARYKA